MIRKLFIVFSAAFLIGQEAPFNDFVMGFWPEYDHPGVLVTIQIDIPPEALPYDIEVELPAGSKMALKKSTNANGEQEMVNQEIIISDDRPVMPIHLTETEYFAQFYFNPFDESEIRKMDYNFRANKELGHFHIVVQEHMLAENFSTNFKNPETFMNDFKLRFHKQHIDHLSPKEAFNIQFSYENPTRETTVNVLQKNMANHPEIDQTTPIEQDNSQFENVKQFTIPVLILLIVILAMILRKNLSTKPNVPSKNVAKSGQQFCKRCGASLSPDSLFCTKCGVKKDVS